MSSVSRAGIAHLSRARRRRISGSNTVLRCPAGGSALTTRRSILPQDVAASSSLAGWHNVRDQGRSVARPCLQPETLASRSSCDASPRAIQPPPDNGTNASVSNTLGSTPCRVRPTASRLDPVLMFFAGAHLCSGSAVHLVLDEHEVPDSTSRSSSTSGLLLGPYFGPRDRRRSPSRDHPVPPRGVRNSSRADLHGGPRWTIPSGRQACRLASESSSAPSPQQVVVDAEAFGAVGAHGIAFSLK